MPFTLAHPAAVLALRAARRLPMVALLAGSITPDLEYLAHLRPYGPFLHSALGALVDIPLGLGVALVIDRAVEPALRWEVGLPDKPRALTSSVWALAATAIGVATHLAWDSITHPAGVLVRVLPVLSVPVCGVLPLFKVLQYVSSIVGLGVVVGVAARWLWRQLEATRRRAAWLVAGAGCTAVVLGLANAVRAAGLQQQVGYFLVGALVGLCVAAVAITALASGRSGAA
jgi:hypothetical protein